MKHFHRSLVIGCSMLALSACGPEDIASPGTGSVTINNTTNNTTNNPAPTPTPTPTGTPTPSPTPTPTPTPGPTYTAAGACPTIADPQGLTDGGVIVVPGGTIRVCSLPNVVNVSSTLIDTPDNAKVAFEMPGRVDVGADGGAAATASDTNVELTIEPGVVVFGGVGNSHLVVNRGNKIAAIGTQSSPIVFTSRQNILGNTTDDSDGQWGGVILLGRGPISDCEDGGATGGTTACINQVEGTPLDALYGGATPGDDSGDMRYVQLRYSGFAFDQDNELQSLTTGGTGSATGLDFIQTVNSSDDGVEFFGGHVNGKRFVVLGSGDDALDTDFGAQINLQWIIAIQRTATGNSIIEADTGGGGNDLPRQDTRIANATFVARSTVSDAAAIRLRGGTDFALANIVMDASALTGRACFDIDDTETFQAAGTEEDGAPFIASVFMECSATGAFDADVDAGGNESDVFAATSNNLWTGGTAKNSAFTATLTNMFVNGANENGATSFNPTVFNRNGFVFDNPGYVGGAAAADTWYQTWTCNTSYAALSGATDCADSPFA